MYTYLDSQTGKKCFSRPQFELLASFIIDIIVVIIILFFWQNTMLIGVNCDTNDAKVAKLSSTSSGGKRTFKCTCDGTLTTGETTMYCHIHYWECQS